MLALQQAWAHSKNKKGVPQAFRTHAINVADLASRFAAKFNAATLGRRSGLLHDIGKLLDDWQVYVRGYASEEREDHRAAGAVYAYRAKRADLAFAIAGHHGGLPSRTELIGWLKSHSERPQIQLLLDVIDELLPELADGQPLEKPDFLNDPLSLEFFIRMLFSALVDADWLDTEAHFSPHKTRIRSLSQQQQPLDRLYTKLRAKIESMSLDGPVNQYRRSVWKACQRAAPLPQGFFRLTVPTGGGKTYSSMGFALLHALHHNLERVIVAIPYTSIIEQTADVFRHVFGADEVLEHHSGVLEEALTNPNYTPTWTKLASENWDSRIVITTTVQLFESLFANQPSKCRKLHNLANSVIILDEVQTLPSELLLPILDGLKQLVAHYGVTVLLCTATQPALDESPYLEGLPNVREIMPNTVELYDALKRVNYQIVKEPWTWDQVAAEMKKAAQCMTVVNTIGDSLALLMAMRDVPSVMYLSTNICGAHRRAVLAEVKRRLSAGEPIHLITTQVVEAGVDIDFPKVMRAMGPLDRIVQAAGRANREGKLSTLGEVIIFTPADGKLPPGPYLFATYLAGKYLNKPDVNLHDPELYTRYFKELYRMLRKDLDKYQIQLFRKQFDYPEVAKRFRMIPDDTAPVVVHYRFPHDPDADPAADLIQQVRSSQKQWLTWQVMRKLQPYIVQVRQKDLELYLSQGKAVPIIPGLYEWQGDYDAVFGIRGKHFDA